MVKVNLDLSYKYVMDFKIYIPLFILCMESLQRQFRGWLNIKMSLHYLVFLYIITFIIFKFKLKLNHNG